MTIKVTKIAVHVIKCDLDIPFAFSQGWVKKRSATLVEIKTNEGITGWGEAFCQGLEPPEISAAVIENSLSELIIDQNPLDIELLWHKMYNQTRDFGRKGSVVAAISAIDIALWDITGKYYNTPVYNLLGGKYRDRIRTYTYIYERDVKTTNHEAIGAWTTDPQRLGELASDLADEGFTGLKFDPLPQKVWRKTPFPPWEVSQKEYDHAEQSVKAIREAVGTRADILIGTHGQITPSAARRLAARVEQYDPLWLEEPCPPENYKEMGKIARSTSIPIASGERLVTLHEFQNLFDQGGCAFAQPDLGSCGGITACKKISSLAEANYVLMAPHVWGGPIITAAALQIDANIPNFLIQESIGKSDGFFDEIIKEPFVWEDGDLIISDKPGIGIELDEDKLENHRSKLSDLR